MNDRTQIVVLAKRPRPGHVKTRLTPPYTPEEAADLAAAALADTLDAVAATPAAARVLAADAGPDDAGPDDLPPGFELVRQRGGGLDERLAWAFHDVHARRPLPVVLVGMDTPQLTAGLLTRAAAALEDHDAVFGPAADGGFWLLGLRRPDPALLLGVPMSRPDTGAAQLRRLSGLSVAMLPALIDVDDAEDAREVAELAPHTRFAATLARFGTRPQAALGVPHDAQPDVRPDVPPGVPHDVRPDVPPGVPHDVPPGVPPGVRRDARDDVRPDVRLAARLGAGAAR